MTTGLTYVYCLVRSARQPRLAGLPSGMPGAGPARALAAGRDLWLIAATVPARGYGEEALARGLQDLEWVSRHAVAHQSVVARFLRARALVPMQLFTLFSSDERAVAHVAGQRRHLTRILDRVDGRLEWGLRLVLAPGPAAPRPDRRAPAPSAGTAYLREKRDRIGEVRRRRAAARAAANRVFRALSRAAAAARRHVETEDAAAGGSRLLLDAAFLVPRAESAAFRKALARQLRSPAPTDVEASLTGPWPPYNFVGRTASRGAGR